MTKSELIITLERIRMKYMCAYVSPNFCDCKFSDNFRLPLNTMSEQGNGCPEMRTIINFIKELPEDEF